MFASLKQFFGGMCLALMFFALAGFCVYKEFNSVRLLWAGQQTVARVTHTKSTRDARRSNSSTSYYVYYQGLAQGQEFTGWKSVSLKQFGSLHKDDTVAVTYLPSDPTINCLGGRSDICWDLAVYGGFTLLFVVLGSASAAFAVKG